MPVHDWTRVDAGIFHSFHLSWLAEFRKLFNNGVLPDGYYALIEHHASQPISALLTLPASPLVVESFPPLPSPDCLDVAETPPRVRHTQTISPSVQARRRTLAIRHVSGHRLVALLEIVSPANKDRAQTVEDFATKVTAALKAGIHVLIVDLFPPGPHDPQGMQGAILLRMDRDAVPYELPPGEPITLASYVAELEPTEYVEPVAIGAVLPKMPLFFSCERYIAVPLEATYQEAYRGVPAFWRAALEGRSA